MFLPVNVSAQDSWICPITNADIPASGNINCTVTDQTNDAIRISVSERVISTTVASAYGILGWHQGTGNSAITVSGGSIVTEGQASHGIWGQHEGSGNKTISVTKADITTKESNSYGIYANFHTAANKGNIRVSVSGGSIITEKLGAIGILHDM